MNKEALKRYSTFANAVSLVIAAVMIYVPEMVPTQYTPHVMAICSAIVALCQAVKQGAKDEG